MMTKALFSAAAIVLIGGAAAAQDRIPQSSPASPNTVNPPASQYQLRTGDGDNDADDIGAPQTVIINGQARVPISADVAARTGVPIQVVTNGPVPDTPANRAKFGGPMSHAGKMTTPAGN